MPVTLISKNNTSGTSTVTTPADGALTKGELALGFSTDPNATALFVGTGTGGTDAPILIGGGRNVVIRKTEIGTVGGVQGYSVNLDSLAGLSTTANNIIVANGSEWTAVAKGALATKNSIDLSTSEVTNTLPIARGGTGATSLGAGKLLIGNGTNAIAVSTVSVDANNTLSLGASGSFQLSKLSEDPTSPTAGRMYYGGSGQSNDIKFYNGSRTSTLAFEEDLDIFHSIGGVLANGTSTSLIILASNGVSFTANNTTKTLEFTTTANTANGANTIVARNGSGNFSANEITAKLFGNANTATKWQTARNINMSGDVTGNVLNVDGSSHITISNMAINTTYVSSISVNTSHLSLNESGEGSAKTIVLEFATNPTIPGNLTVSGDLTVSGNSTVVNTTNLEVKDALIMLQSGLTAGNTNDIGFIFERGTTGNNAAFIWDESADKFTLGTTTATGANTGNIEITKGELDATVNWDNISNKPTFTSGTVTSVGISLPTGLESNTSTITTSGTFGITFQTGYSIPTDANQTNWTTAYTDRLKWDGGATDLNASTGRTSLGATTIGSNLFTLTNPSAKTFLRINANNTATARNAAEFKSDLSLNNVENVALSTWAGSSSITTVGTVTSGTIDGGTY